MIHSARIFFATVASMMSGYARPRFARQTRSRRRSRAPPVPRGPPDLRICDSPACSDVKLASREPIALHWPVMENGADPARPILPGEQRQIADRVDRRGADGAVIDPHRPADEAGLRAAIEKRRLVQITSWLRPVSAATCSGVYALEEFLEFGKTGSVLLDVVAIDQVVRGSGCARCRSAARDRSAASAADAGPPSWRSW